MFSGALSTILLQPQVLVTIKKPRFGAAPHWRCILVPSQPSCSIPMFWCPSISHVLGLIPLETCPG